jgi:hypothetical protein
MKKAGIVVSVSLCLILLSTSAFAWGLVHKSFGQTVYVPVSVSESVPGKHRTITRVNIANTDPVTPITVVAVEVYDHDGKFVEDLLAGSEPRTLYPLDDPGSPGTNNTGFTIRPPLLDFLPGSPSVRVIWEAERRVIPALISSFVLFIVNDSAVHTGGETIAVMSLSTRVIEERRGHRRP